MLLAHKKAPGHSEELLAAVGNKGRGQQLGGGIPLHNLQKNQPEVAKQSVNQNQPEVCTQAHPQMGGHRVKWSRLSVLTENTKECQRAWYLTANVFHCVAYFIVVRSTSGCTWSLTLNPKTTLVALPNGTGNEWALEMGQAGNKAHTARRGGSEQAHHTAGPPQEAKPALAPRVIPMSERMVSATVLHCCSGWWLPTHAWRKTVARPVKVFGPFVSADTLPHPAAPPTWTRPWPIIGV